VMAPSRWIVGDGRAFIGKAHGALPGASAYWQTTHVFEMAWRFETPNAALAARRDFFEIGNYQGSHHFMLWEVNA
jgi:hypothetical protein